MSDTSHPADRPRPDELDDLIAAVIGETRHLLATDHWVVLKTESMVVAAHAAAALAHCCTLAEELVEAHRSGREMTGRLLARALFETWVIGYFIQLGGLPALEVVAADYVFGRRAAGRAMEDHDRELRERIKKTRERNRKIDETNEGIKLWNEQHSDLDPKPLLERISEPHAVFADLTVEDFIGDLPAVEPSSTSLYAIVQRLSPIAREHGFEETYELSYHYAYRSLSTFGAHANLWVLNAYLDDRDGNGIFLRVRDDPASSIVLRSAEP